VIKLEVETSPRIPNEFFAHQNPYSKNEMEEIGVQQEIVEKV
jgi:hypothetical protein